jgi:hypothetical protein
VGRKAVGLIPDATTRFDMKHRYLEVTFRCGKPLAAYLYLPRSGVVKVARTNDAGHSLRVDYDAAEHAIGVEITSPFAVDIEHINEVLASLGQAPLLAEEWAPTGAA